MVAFHPLASSSVPDRFVYIGRDLVRAVHRSGISARETADAPFGVRMPAQLETSWPINQTIKTLK
jgi:hypothetical protein